MTTDYMLGRSVDDDEIGTLTLIPLETTLRIQFRSLELEALCPAVAHVQPDIYDMAIDFVADHSIESKSLKLWLVTFREQRIFAEHLAIEIGRKIENTLTAGGAVLDAGMVTLVQNVRGGIIETVHYQLGGN